MPARFSVGNRAELWTNWRLADNDRKVHGEAMSSFIMRLRSDATPEAVASLLKSTALDHQPERYARLTLRVQPLSDRLIGKSGQILWTLSGAVGLVLLVACLNAGSVLVVRGLTRRRETAVRVALGANRWQLIRPVLSDAAALAFVAVIAGSALAWTMVAGLRRMLEDSVSLPLPRLNQTAVDGAALAVALAAAVVCIFLASAAPAVAAMRVQPASAFGDGSRSASAGRSTVRFGIAATVVQTALSVVLLVGAGLLLRSVSHLIEQDPGYERDGVLTARIPMPFDVRQRYGNQAEYEHYRGILNRAYRPRRTVCRSHDSIAARSRGGVG
jgi:predicted lysophospholipase L1 biosynthesis ABC-type transport system permease subunit